MKSPGICFVSLRKYSIDLRWSKDQDWHFCGLVLTDPQPSFILCFILGLETLFLQFVQSSPNSTFWGGNVKKCTNTIRGSQNRYGSKQRKQRRQKLLPANFSFTIPWKKDLLDRQENLSDLVVYLVTDNYLRFKSDFGIQENHAI